VIDPVSLFRASTSLVRRLPDDHACENGRASAPALRSHLLLPGPNSPTIGQCGLLAGHSSGSLREGGVKK